MKNRSTSKSVAALLAAVVLATLVLRPAGATPPVPLWRQLEERAAREGAEAVRESYHREVLQILAGLEKPSNVTSVQESFQRLLKITWLFDFLRSWAFVEARDLRMNKAGRAEVAGAALDPILRNMEKGMVLYSREVPRMERLMTEMKPAESQKLGLPHSPEASVANDRNQMLRHVALLAKMAGTREDLERVFHVAPVKIDSASTAEEFLRHHHDYDALLGIPTVEREKQVGTAGVSEEEKEAIRQIVQDFWQAFVRRDAAAVERLYLDRAFARTLTARMPEVDLVSFDLSQASFQFERIAPDLIRVRVDNVAGVKMKNGQRVDTVGGKTFKIAMRNGQALIVAVGGAS